MVKDRLQDATESAIYMCGMNALDQDDLFYAMLHCDPSFECETQVGLDFYA